MKGSDDLPPCVSVTGMPCFAAKAASVDGQMEKLSRELKELKDDVGRAFQSELKAVVEHLQNLVGWLKRRWRDRAFQG